MRKIEGAFALVLCALFWSTGGVLIKFIDASSFAIAGLRSLIALVVCCAAMRRLPVFRIVREGAVDRGMTACLWAAAVGYSATMILFCVANKLTTAANTILLQYTNPVYIIVFSPILLGEKNSRRDYLTALGVMFGMVLFFVGDIDGGNMLGNFLAALSGVSFAFCTIFMRKLRTAAASAFMIAHFITACVCVPFCFVKTGGVYGAPRDFVSVVALVLLGVFQMAVATLLYSRGIAKVTALGASIITMIEPLMNPVWVMIFAREFPSLTCVLGGGVILSCILAREVFGAKASLQ